VTGKQEYSKGNRDTSTVRVLLILVSMLGLLFGVVGCGDDDEVQITSTSPLPDGTVGQAMTSSFSLKMADSFGCCRMVTLPPDSACNRMAP
jgi:hypothetical protein